MSWNITFPNEEPASGLVNCTVSCVGEWSLNSVHTYEKESSELPNAIKNIMGENEEYAMVINIESGGSSSEINVTDSNSDAEYTEYNGEPCNFIVVAWDPGSSEVMSSKSKSKGRVTRPD